MQTNFIQLVWYCKHNVVVLNGQGVLYQVVNPESLFCCLAFRAMPIAAAIVTVTHRATVFTGFFVSAEGSRSATNDFAQHPVLQRGKFCFRKQAGTK
jgi:hypothetical protein